MNKLKPCPFCGKKPKTLQFKGEYAIACMNKKCIFEVMTHVFGTKTEAVKEWNTRSGERGNEK